jgi:hypothetical protein
MALQLIETHPLPSAAAPKIAPRMNYAHRDSGL